MRAALPLALLAACGAPEAPPAAASHAEDPAISWAAAVPATTLPVAVLPAEVVPAPDARSALAPGINLQIRSVAVATGDHVAVGGVVAWVDGAELREALDRPGALREIASASAAHRDAVGAAADAGVSRDIDRLMANEEALRSRADAAVASTRAGGLSLRRIGGRIAWISPWEGVLQESRCGPGPVAADVACFVLTRGQAQVRVDVPQRHLGRLTDEATGAFVDVTGAVHEGLAVARRAPDIATETRTMSWWFSIPDPGHIGATGRAELRVPPPPGAMEVPVSAVTPLGGQDHVFLRTGPTPVEVLGRDADRVVVRALPDGAEVAVRGVLRLKAKALLAEEEEG